MIKPSLPGLLPILYSKYFSRGSVQLPLNEAVRDIKLEKEAFEGWPLFLFWLPAICDIFGATVRKGFLR